MYLPIVIHITSYIALYVYSLSKLCNTFLIKVSHMLPGRFTEQQVRVYCKRLDGNSVKAAWKLDMLMLVYCIS